MYIHITIHKSNYSWQTKPLKLTILPRTFMYAPKANPKQKRVETTEEHEKVHCYWTIRLAGWLLAVASKHCSLPHYSSPWRADGEQTLLSVTLQFAVASKITRRGELWQTSVGRNDFSPQKPKFSSTPIPILIGNSTCDDSTTWTSIIHKFYGLSTPLTTDFYPMT